MEIISIFVIIIINKSLFILLAQNKLKDFVVKIENYRLDYSLQDD